MHNNTETFANLTHQQDHRQPPTMIKQSILCCPPGQMMNLNRTRTSILRPNELVEIQGSYWPRILVVSESGERRKKSSVKKSSINAKASAASSAKVSRRFKKKMELIRQLKKLPKVPSSSSLPHPISPSYEASPNSLSSISAFDQNTSPCWNPQTKDLSKTKTSSFTGRPVFPSLDNTTSKPTGQSSSGLKGPRRRKSLKGVVAPR